jgi:ribosomal protein S18 acetylase RimI-like enzyme
MMEFRYAQQSASKDNIFTHLMECDNLFIPPLSKTINLDQYSNKLSTNAETFEVWAKEQLISLVAAYLNDFESKVGFITNVSTSPEYTGNGLAQNLLRNCIGHSKKLGFISLMLQVHCENTLAIRLYKKFNFVEVGLKAGQITMSLDLLKK